MFIALEYALLFLSLLLLLQVLRYTIAELKSLVREEGLPFECGFELRREVRLPFSLSYFYLTLIFLLFDLEIVFLAFVPAHVFTEYHDGIIVWAITVLILISAGLAYEIKEGSLEWSIGQ